MDRTMAHMGQNAYSIWKSSRPGGTFFILAETSHVGIHDNAAEKRKMDAPDPRIDATTTRYRELSVGTVNVLRSCFGCKSVKKANRFGDVGFLQHDATTNTAVTMIAMARIAETGPNISIFLTQIATKHCLRSTQKMESGKCP
jgi:hypothetical protein